MKIDIVIQRLLIYFTTYSRMMPYSPNRICKNKFANALPYGIGQRLDTHSIDSQQAAAIITIENNKRKGTTNVFRRRLSMPAIGIQQHSSSLIRILDIATPRPDRPAKDNCVQSALHSNTATLGMLLDSQ